MFELQALYSKPFLTYLNTTIYDLANHFFVHNPTIATLLTLAIDEFSKNTAKGFE